MNETKRNRIHAATIAAMFLTFAAGVAGAQAPVPQLAVDRAFDGPGARDRDAQFGGPGGRMGGPGRFGGPGGEFGPDMGGPGGRMGGPGMMGGPGAMGRRPQPGVVEIPAKALAALLGLSADQTDRIAAIQKTARPPRPEMGRPGRPNGGRAIWGTRSDDGPDGRPGAKHADAEPGRPQGDPREAHKKAKADIMAVLTDSQKARLPQVMQEVEALRADRIPLDALDTIALSGDQHKKIAEIGAEAHKKLVALLTSDNDDSENAESPQDIHEGMGDDVNAILTSDQRAKVRLARRQHRPEGGAGMMMPPPPGGMDGGMMPPPPGGRMGGGPMGGPQGPDGMGFDGPRQGPGGMGFDGPPPPGGPDGEVPQFGAGNGPRRSGAHRGGRPQGPGAEGGPAGMRGADRGPGGPDGFGPPPPDGGDVL